MPHETIRPASAAVATTLGVALLFVVAGWLASVQEARAAADDHDGAGGDGSEAASSTGGDQAGGRAAVEGGPRRVDAERA